MLEKEIPTLSCVIEKYDILLTDAEGLQLMHVLADHYGFELTKLEKPPEDVTIN